MSSKSANPSPGPDTFGVDGRFSFDCRSDLPCFGQCCRDINIFLTPYDIIRLKNKLGIPSSGFLEKYTDDLRHPQIPFPLVYLKMKEKDQLRCPFVTPGGCQVYQERPWSCRMAPVDLVGPGVFRLAFDRQNCLGLNEEREWTVSGWMGSQDMDIYDEVESSFRDIPGLVRFTGREDLDRRIVQLFRMVCYDIDTFRDFIKKNKFLAKEGDIDPGELVNRPVGDEAGLLKAGTRWLVSVSGRPQALKKIDNILKSRN